MSIVEAEAGRTDADDWSRVDVRIAYTRMAPRLLPVLAGVVGLRACIEADEPGPDTEVLIGYQFPPGSLAGLPRLRWVHLTGTGVDHLARAGLPAGVLVTTSAAVPVTAVAEYAVAGLLLLTKDLIDVVAGRPADWFTSRATLLAGSTVGVVGVGRIGRAVVDRLTALGAKPVAVTRTGRPAIPEAVCTIGAERLTAEASTLDHLVACLPGSAGTAGLIGADVIAALPPHATVVNVGRASTLDTAALYAALREGRLRGAFLDVHEIEPMPPDDPAWSVPGLVVSPHRAFCFPGEPAGVAAAFLDNLDDLRGGRPPRDRVAWPGRPS